jgi:transcriptional regulator
VDDLPEAYVNLLALREQGATDDDVADALGVPVESVPLLETLARRKRDNRRDGP